MEEIRHSSFYLPLDHILQDIYSNNIKVERKKTKRIFRVVQEYLHAHCEYCPENSKSANIFFNEKKIELLIGALKQSNRVFTAIFNRLTPAGSFFDKLMIFSPKEFDFNIILFFPFDYSKLKVEKKGNHYRFVELNVLNALQALDKIHCDVLSAIQSWIDADGYFREDKIRFWFEGVINIVLNTFPEFHEMKLRKTGPAFTISVLVDGKTVDVDLVLAIELPAYIQPPTKRAYVSKHPWFVITKSSKNEKRLWQMSFPLDEKELMTNKGNLKLVCKLLKALKENQNNVKVASYAIKTLFLLELTICDAHFWENNIGFIFVWMVRRLMLSFKCKHLGYFWNNESNLYHSYSSSTFITMENFLKNIIFSIHNKLNVGDIQGLKEYLYSTLVKK